MTDTQFPQQNFWDRWHWVWSALFYVSLIIPLTIVWVNGELVRDERNWAAAWVLLGCGWHWFGTTQLTKFVGDKRPLRDQPIVVIAYLSGAILIWTRLIAFHPLFNFHLGGLVGQFFIYLNIQWAILGVAIVTAIQIVMNAYLTGEPISLRDPAVWGPLMGIGASGLLGLWITGISAESVRRQELLEELRRTQSDLAESERNAGMLAERQRLAHEIHDTLAQGFIGIIMHLEAATQSLADHPMAHKHVAQAEAMARENLQQARYLVEGLHPKRLQEASLPDAITQTVEQWREQSKVAAHVTITGEERPLPSDTDHTLLRATQEALANVHKHAQAQAVTITLSYMGDLVMLDVQDDGVGLNGADSQWQGGFGLTAMRERVEQLGGSLLVESEDDEGTTVVVSIPVIGD